MRKVISVTIAVLLCFTLSMVTVYASSSTEEKISWAVNKALEENPEQLTVAIRYQDVDKSDLISRLLVEQQEYQDTLDKTIYSDDEIIQLGQEYYAQRWNSELDGLYCDCAAQIAKAIGIEEGCYLYGRTRPVLSAALTPDQIKQASNIANVTEIILGYDYLTPPSELSTEDFTPPTDAPSPTVIYTQPSESTTDPPEVYGDFNHDGVVNASDASVILIYAAEYGAGKYTGTFEEYVNR